MEARRAIAERLEARQASSNTPNARQYWENDFADVDYVDLGTGAYSVDWSNPPGGNFVIGKGWQPARDLKVNYTASFSTTGAAYLALYGWTTNPLVEYYVIEAMGNHNPSDNISSTQYGCVTSDGGTYEIWQKKRINAPSIQDDHTDFEEYWSVRRSMRAGGTRQPSTQVTISGPGKPSASISARSSTWISSLKVKPVPATLPSPLVHCRRRAYVRHRRRPAGRRRRQGRVRFPAQRGVLPLRQPPRLRRPRRQRLSPLLNQPLSQNAYYDAYYDAHDYANYDAHDQEHQDEGYQDEDYEDEDYEDYRGCY
ncbi:hypothetical protein LTR09_006615 [Extremus antarcticus]|uniref:Endo-1,4-beta-xylanase n=1 Tax=Extremus antarcticus TaxID=702011 RepID=A0AAJ0DL14_9PEZI|nr:hypothetical protein LTR09_006615 [Extremus antarcticus]